MELTESRNTENFAKDLSRLAAMRISRVWFGFANVLFLECGRLTKQQRVTSATGNLKIPKSTLKGQVTFMLECDWRVENKYSVAFGRQSGSRMLSHRGPKMVGIRIESVKANGSIPELSIVLKNGQVIRTFQAFGGPPNWSIGFNDLRLIDVDSEWKLNDVSVWLGFKNKSFMRFYCFDDATFKPRKFLKAWGRKLE